MTGTDKIKEQENEQERSSQEEIKELTQTLQRLQAEFENYKKRIEKEKSDFASFACKDIIEKLIPILDNFELALTNTEGKSFMKGIELIYAQFVALLEDAGLKKIECTGKKFDPTLHEALLTEKSDKENIVLEELQKGYTLKEKVIRHSKVKVGKR